MSVTQFSAFSAKQADDVERALAGDVKCYLCETWQRLDEVRVFTFLGGASTYLCGTELEECCRLGEIKQHIETQSR